MTCASTGALLTGDDRVWYHARHGCGKGFVVPYGMIVEGKHAMRASLIVALALDVVAGRVRADVAATSAAEIFPLVFGR